MLALYRAGRQAEALQAYQDGATRRSSTSSASSRAARSSSCTRAILRQERRTRRRRDARSAVEDHFERCCWRSSSGRLVPVLGAEIGELARGSRSVSTTRRTTAGELPRVAQYVAVMKGSGPLYDELHELLDVDARADAGASVLRLACRPCFASAALPHQLLVTTSYDLRSSRPSSTRARSSTSSRTSPAGRTAASSVTSRPTATARLIDVPNTYATELSLERRTVILKLHGGGRSRPGARVGELRHHRGRLHRLPRADATSPLPFPVALAAKLRRSHFLFLGYGMRDWNLRVVLQPALGRPAGQLPLVGGPADGAAARASVLARARRRRAGADLEDVRRAAARTRVARGVVMSVVAARRSDPVQGSRIVRGHGARCAALLRPRARHPDDCGEPDRLALHRALRGERRRQELGAQCGRRARHARARAGGARRRPTGTWTGGEPLAAMTAAVPGLRPAIGARRSLTRSPRWPKAGARRSISCSTSSRTRFVARRLGLRLRVARRGGDAARAARARSARISEDALSELDVFTGLIPNVFGNYLPLDRLDREAARAAITGPVERMARARRRTVGRDRAWSRRGRARRDRRRARRARWRRARRRRPSDRRPHRSAVPAARDAAPLGGGAGAWLGHLRRSTLDELGGARGILRAHLERALARARSGRAATPRRACSITSSRRPGTKVAHRVADLAEYAGVPEDEVRRVLAKLAPPRIVRPLNGSVELYHDVLADAVLAWRMQHDAERRLEQQRAASHARQRRLAIAVASVWSRWLR